MYANPTGLLSKDAFRVSAFLGVHFHNIPERESCMLCAGGGRVLPLCSSPQEDPIYLYSSTSELNSI